MLPLFINEKKNHLENTIYTDTCVKIKRKPKIGPAISLYHLLWPVRSNVRPGHLHPNYSIFSLLILEFFSLVTARSDGYCRSVICRSAGPSRG